MSKQENIGKRALMKGNAAQDARNQAEAEVFFKKAITAYSEALDGYVAAAAIANTSANADAEAAANASAKIVTENLSAAYLNLSSSFIEQNKLDEAKQILTEADDKGLSSADFKHNLMAVHHASGLIAKKDGNLDIAIDSFKAVKDADVKNVDVHYEFALALLNKGLKTVVVNAAGAGGQVMDMVTLQKAEAEFKELLTKELDEKLKLNSYCKLIKCQSALNGNTSDALKEAVSMLNGLDITQHSEAAYFIYTSILEKSLASDHDKALETIELVKTKECRISSKNSVGFRATCSAFA